MGYENCNIQTSTGFDRFIRVTYGRTVRRTDDSIISVSYIYACRRTLIIVANRHGFKDSVVENHICPTWALYVDATCGKRENINSVIDWLTDGRRWQNPQVAVPFTLNNSIICLLIVNGRLPLSLFIHSVDQGLWRIEYLNTGRASSPKMWGVSLLPVVANW